MKIDARYVLRTIAIALIAVLTATQISFAADVSFALDGQDAATQAAQQAIAAQQTAMQQAQQASQQAMQDAQQANQTAMQAAQQASSNTGVSTSQTKHPVSTTTFPVGPIPARIGTARTVYLTNDGADPNFPVDENQAYNAVFAALQGWGHYQFVPDPQQADLIFSIRDAAPISGVYSDGDGNSYSVNSPTFILTIVDAKTNTELWTITSPVIAVGSGKKEAQWFALSVQNLVSRVKVIAGQPLTLDEQANLTTFPKNHSLRTVLLITGITVGAGVAGGLILHHEFEKSVDNMNKQSQQWCIDHGFPASDCIP